MQEVNLFLHVHVFFYCSFGKTEKDVLHHLEQLDHVKEFEKLDQLLPYNDDIFTHYDFEAELPDLDNDPFFYPPK